MDDVEEFHAAFYQSYLSGIKTTFCEDALEAFDTINRTLVELKQH